MPAGSSSSPQSASLIITIDGPAGTGKSTVGHRLARRLGLEVLDTGAMYRAAALIAIEQSISPADGAALARAVEHARMRFDWSASPPRLLLGDRDVSARVRDADVAAIVSIVAAQPELRQTLVRAQRDIARQHPRLVSEGRDQGSVVFPDAQVRFYLDAAESVRAARRAAQLAAAGKSAPRDRVLDEIQQRDHLDSSRAEGPLMKPAGAVIMDTSAQNVDEVVAAMELEVRRLVPALRRGDSSRSDR